MNSVTSRATFAAFALPLILITGAARADQYFQSWAQVYADPSTVSQFPHAVALDSRGNVFVTGHQIVGSDKGIYAAKYDALDGHLVWSRQISPSAGNEFIANDIAVNAQGDCVVTGSRTVSGSIDYYTIKLRGTDGLNAWPNAMTFNGLNDGEDTALKAIFDLAGDVIVTGRATGNNGVTSTGFDWVTLKYNGTTGTQLFLDRYTQTTGNLDDVPAGLALDSNNRIYVVGTVKTASNESRFYLRHLNADLSKHFDIAPIDTGSGGSDSEGGATAVTVDSDDNVIATGIARDASSHFGYFTIKLDSNGGEFWRSSNGPFSADTFGTLPRPGPVGIAVGPDKNPIVTGSLRAANGDYVIRTVKYTSAGFFFNAAEFWETPSIDVGLGSGDTRARAIIADAAGNAIVVGESRNENGNSDVYIAKYDSQTGQKVFNIAYNGSFGSSTDIGVDIDTDHFGNIVALGQFVANKGTGIGLAEFGTVKLNRLIAPTGEELPDGIAGVADDATIKGTGIPAISTNGGLAAQLSFKAGRKGGNALLVEGSPAGGVTFPAVKGQPAPVAVGEPAANWTSFSDPILAPNGSYAFAGKVSGPGSKASGVWADLNGTLRLVLRQGSIIPVAGSTDKFISLTSMGIADNNLIALAKLSTTKSALLRIDQNNVGTELLRTGQSGLMINGEDYTVKTITIFAPPRSEAGDGRWQGSGGIVAKVAATKTSDPKAKATAIVSISNTGTKNAFMFTGQTAATPISAESTYSDFGLPSTASGTLRFATKATLTEQPKSTNSALIFSSSGAAFNAFAQKGVATGVTGLPAGVTYADFSDPIVNTSSLVAYLATLAGSSADVKSSSNKAIIFGSPTGVRTSIARTGDFAPDQAGLPTEDKWTSFTALALPDGTNAGPIFVAKISAKKNNLGLWARDSSGKVRRLLLTGDELGDLAVKKFTVLSVVKGTMSAERSFDGGGSVVVALSFTNKTTALYRIGIP